MLFPVVNFHSYRPTVVGYRRMQNPQISCAQDKKSINYRAKKISRGSSSVSQEAARRMQRLMPNLAEKLGRRRRSQHSRAQKNADHFTNNHTRRLRASVHAELFASRWTRQHTVLRLLTGHRGMQLLRRTNDSVGACERTRPCLHELIDFTRRPISVCPLRFFTVQVGRVILIFKDA